MQHSYSDKKLKFIIDVIYLALVAGIVYLVFKYALAWILPFIIGFAVAAIISPLVRMLNRRAHIPKGLSSGLLVLGFFALVAFLIGQLVQRIAFELNNLVHDLPSISQNLLSIIDRLLEKFSNFSNLLPDNIADMLTSAINSSLSSLPDVVYKFVLMLGGGIKDFAISLPNVFIFILATIVSSILISSEYSYIKAFIYMQIPEKVRGIIFEAREHLVLTIFRMFRAYLIIIVVTFCELSVGFLIIGIEYAITLAFIIAIVDILPILGVGTVLVPWAVISLINGHYGLAISLLLIYGFVTAVRQAIEPKIVGNQIGLPPLVTLICIYVGLKIFGVLGMFIAPIFVIILCRLQDSGYFKLWTPLHRSKNKQEKT
ncbi:MAG: sporulation integral membrane protein YtvI [Bacillota bacterium]|nr:sporulation integral membrane protein YtvI [Bacillota bacterium]